jgi:hypothetical protein
VLNLELTGGGAPAIHLNMCSCRLRIYNLAGGRIIECGILLHKQQMGDFVGMGGNFATTKNNFGATNHFW